MKRIALKYLVCPKCKTEFTLSTRSIQSEIISGLLRCQNDHRYRIVRGIPRLLIKQTSALQKKTTKSFGFEWTKFGKLFPEYKRNFINYISPIGKTHLKKRIVLDAGCGMGRHTYYASQAEAQHVFGVDISESVEVAYQHCRNLPNVTIVQADIYNLPFDHSLDYAFSIGVLHHLPDPEKGFRSVLNTVKPGGLVSIWVYGKKNNFSNVYIYEPLRSFTRHLPHLAVFFLSFPIGFAIHFLNRLEQKIASIIGVINIDSWPFGYYSRFPLTVKVNDAFDVLATPKSRYYLKKEIQLWFKQAGLTNITTLYLRKKSIKAFGYVPR